MRWQERPATVRKEKQSPVCQCGLRAAEAVLARAVGKWTASGQGQGKTASARCTWFLLSFHSPRSLVVWRKVFEDDPFRQFRSAAATTMCSVHYVYAFQLLGQMERLHRIVPDSSTSRLQLLVRRLHEIRLAPSASQRGVLICRSSLSRTSQVVYLFHPASASSNPLL